jgi:hypothetical protein
MSKLKVVNPNQNPKFLAFHNNSTLESTLPGVIGQYRLKLQVAVGELHAKMKVCMHLHVRHGQMKAHH